MFMKNKGKNISTVYMDYCNMVRFLLGKLKKEQTVYGILIGPALQLSLVLDIVVSCPNRP